MRPQPLKPLRFFNPIGPDRVAVVSFEPAFQQPGQVLIRLARGPDSKNLKQGTTYGPYPEAELDPPINQLVGELEAEGFTPCGHFGLVEMLFSAEPGVRGKVALRIGWRREKSGLGPLLDILKNEKSPDICSVLDGLGLLGDPAAISAIRPFAEKKLLSRRRSAVEALRVLGDEEGLAAMRERTLAQLPDPVSSVLNADDSGKKPARSVVKKVLAATSEVEAKRHGLVCDMLYEMGTPLSVAAARRLLPTLEFDQAFGWRYVKSVFKRAMLRYDFVTFGWLAHAIEFRARTTSGSRATVKSGLDGKQHETWIFGRRTQTGMKRMAWRYMRRLAAYRPEKYATCAAEVLARHTPEDEEAPSGLFPALSRCYLLMRILHGGSNRFRISERALRYRFTDFTAAQKPKDEVREESYPELWDANPAAYIRVLRSATLIDCQEFAFNAIQDRHPDLLQQAGISDLVAMLGSPFEPAVNLALDEVERRLDPANPDWKLVERLANHSLERARQMAKAYLEATSGAWIGDLALLIRFLRVQDIEIRTAVAEAAVAATLSDEAADELSVSLWKLLTSWERPEDDEESAALAGDGLDAVARLCRARLLGQLDASVEFQELLDVVQNGCPSAQSVGGALLAGKPDAFKDLGMTGLVALANHELAAVRAAAHGIVKSAGEMERSILFALSESEWDDTRTIALDMIRALDFTSGPEGFDALVGLLDSNRPDVQDAGKEIFRSSAESFDVGKMLARMAEHPSPNVWSFAIGLAEQQSSELRQLLPVCRASLLHMMPDRRLKDRVLALLLSRGLESESDAQLVVELLQDFTATAVRADLEPALEALVELQLAHPGLDPAEALTVHNAS